MFGFVAPKSKENSTLTYFIMLIVTYIPGHIFSAFVLNKSPATPGHQYLTSYKNGFDS